ncbi:MAG TPA: TIGR00730 family Rossman fold protein [Burkholderiaceae bacterium]|nr:TIGR00730 family Rossman fold protein [Burkholderiaceae bacterium]HQR75888.1 TIGR00730 family Rossman fold protein [Burkholderiaceae bacterium]
MTVRSICVFCGSQSGVRPEYAASAREFAQAAAQRGLTLVFGGGHVGLMGALADAALEYGGQVIGVIPRHLMRPEVAHRRLTDLRIVESMHERKRTMAGLSDAFVVLPGGYGTLEEMFEMVTWLQLQLQSKPVGILNVEQFFDPLLDFLRHVAREGFIRPEHWDLLIVDHTPELLLDRLELHAAEMRKAHPRRADLGRG